jgi:hypothetical protein
VKLLTRTVRDFGLFWWDFLVGETPKLFVAVIAIIVVALVLRHHHHDIDIILLPVVTVLFLMASAFRGSRGNGAELKN